MLGKYYIQFHIVPLHLIYLQSYSLPRHPKMQPENQSQNSIRLDQSSSHNPPSPCPSQPNNDPHAHSQQALNKKRIHRKQQISNFIIKTYRILQEKKNSHIIEWTDGGNSFIVKNKELFENQILPKYFKHKKFSSFVRQLNMYDFHKIRKEKQIPIFKHKFFKMGCNDLLHKIKRKSGDDQETVKNLPPQGDLPSRPEQAPSKPATQTKNKIVHNVSEQIQLITRENNEILGNVGDLSKEIMQLQLSKVKKQQKLIKILSALIYFDIKNPVDNVQQKYSLRQLQNHFMGQDQPSSFLEYARKLGYIYRQIYRQFT